VLENEHGILAPKADGIKRAIESYIALGLESGLFRDASQIRLVELSPSKVEVTVVQCPYLKSCQDLFRDTQNIRNLTCPRIGCFRAAAVFLANLDCKYEVTSINLAEARCTGNVWQA
jgi:hypothetical protein